MSRISDLAGFSTALSTTQDLSVGVITATSFSGDGSGLTGVASTDNVSTSTLSVAGVSTFADAINFSSANTKINADSGINVVLQQSASDKIHFELATQSIRPETANTGEIGNATYPFKKVTAQNLIATEGVNATGVVTAASGSFSGNVTIGGTLTYQDVTNIDSVGIITAQQGIQVLANGVDVTGIGTFEDRLTYDGSLGQAGGGTVTYTVTVASKDSTHRYNGQGSGNGYVIDNLQAPVITLTPGRTYRFDQSDSSNSGHPLRFYYQADKTTQYSTGVTVSGTPGSDGYTEINITDTTPVVLHYQCTAHSLMGNSVITQSNPIVGAGITLNADGGGVHVTGVVTATTFSGELTGVAVTTSSAGLQASNVDFAGLLREQVTVVANKLSAATDINLDNGMAHLFTTTETTTATPNIMSGTGINTDVQIGEAFSVSIITTAAAAGYAATVHIDGVTVGTNGGSLVWNGGSAPSSGGSSGNDYYTYNIIKTASGKYTVLANVSNFA